MNLLLPGLIGVIGMLVGGFLYLLPSRLFYRDTTWLPEKEFLEAFPDKWWVTKAMYGLLPLGFLLFVLVMTSAEDMTKKIHWFFFFPVFLSCMGAMPAIPELLAKASIQVPIGHGSRTPVLFLVSPNAPRAGVVRLAMAFLIVAGFLWCC